MPAGQLQTVLICVPTGDGSTVSPCPAGSGFSTVESYVLSSDSAQYLDYIAQPFDAELAGFLWGTAFVFTLTLYIGSRIYGHLISMVR